MHAWQCCTGERLHKQQAPGKNHLLGDADRIARCLGLPLEARDLSDCWLIVVVAGFAAEEGAAGHFPACGGVPSTAVPAEVRWS